jgi:hypothetical protein
MGTQNININGNIGIKKRKNANTPNFNKIPANNTEPTVDASTCASGNHKCTGNIGIFTPKPKKNNNHNIH